MSFKTDYLAGLITDFEKSLDAAVDAWHTGIAQTSLQEYLGFTDGEYQAFLDGPKRLITRLNSAARPPFSACVCYVVNGEITPDSLASCPRHGA